MPPTDEILIELRCKSEWKVLQVGQTKSVILKSVIFHQLQLHDQSRVHNTRHW